MSDFVLDVSEFARAAKEIIAREKKDAPKYLNKKSLMVIVGGGSKDKGKVKGVMQRTPKANLGQIKNLDIKKLAGAVANKLRKKGKLRGLTAEQFKKEIEKEVKRRLRSRGYTAGPGWHKAAVDLGGRGVKIQSGFPKSEARKGSGKKASEGRLESVIENTAPAAAVIGWEAIQAAIDDVVRDMIEYGAQELLKDNFAKHSAK